MRIKKVVFSARLRTLFAACLLAGVVTGGVLYCFDALASSADRSPTTPSLAFARRMGEGVRRLTDDGQSTPLAWTQDGQTLLVKRPGQVVTQQQLSELWALSVADGSESRVSENAFYPSVHQARVAYLRFVERGQWEAVVSDLAGGEAAKLGEARWNLPPAWVDGNVLYLHRTGQLAASEGSVAPQLSGLPTFQHMRARLSHDGQHVAAADGRYLWVLGEQGQVAVAQADQIWGFAWSPVATRLAYIRSDDGPMPELWVWDAGTDRSWVLAHGELEHFGTPAWSPDGQTIAFVRRPTGNGPNAAGDIWLVNVDGTDLRPLARTRADEHSPCWSPDGQALAFALDGDVWLADLRSPGLDVELAAAGESVVSHTLPLAGMAGDTQITPLSLSAPLTILVKHDGAKNSCRAVPDNQIDEYDFEEYVKRVVPYEVPSSWPTETLKTQAVAARTYAWRTLLGMREKVPYPGYDVWDSTDDQYMCDNTYASTDAAIVATEGQYVSYGGNVIYAFFCAEAGSPTHYQNTLGLTWVPIYLRPVDDPVSFGQTRNGHSVGMSQWGAYRWAAGHGWDYQQILSHYYTSATIEHSSAITQPLASLTLPWPDFYVNTNYAYLRANATDDAPVLTVTFAARITDTWTMIYTDTNGGDGWGYVWPVINYLDTFTPSIGLQITAYDGAGQATASGVSPVGLHRTPPTGTLSISPTEVNTLTVSLNVTATDLAPVSGTIRVGLGNDDWVWEDQALPRTAGTSVADSAAVDGSAWHIAAGTPGVLYGPYTTTLPAGRQYRAYFRLKVPTAALTSSLELAKLDVAMDGGDTLLGVRYVRGTDFKAGSAYQEFPVDFDYPASGGDIEFRTDFYGSFDLWVDRVTIVSYPTEVSSPISWTLPAREGVVTTTARFVDRAGNVSTDAVLTITVTDDSPPGEWRQFQCRGITCTVQMRDVIAGLDVSSAEYEYSTDGGTSWSGWLSAACSGVSGSHDWETITTGSVPFQSASGVLLIRFQVYDVASTANVGQSPDYEIWRVYLPVVMRNR